MDGYTALYPLADGHLIAATDENVSGECVYTGRTMELSTAGFAGVILDENGNVIYQPDESLGYERLYPINSHLILSIRAKTGFDGKSASMCVLDQDGQFCMTAPIVPTILLISWTLMTMASYGLSPAV